jgi:bacterioferritin-associated ferredoxin
VLFAQLLPVVRANGWDLDALMDATGCGDQCGMCQPYLQAMLAEGTTVFHEILTDTPRRDTEAA